MTFALRTTAARVEERCRELRCGTEISVADANRAHAARSLTIRRNAERGTITITVELPLDAGELVDKALDRARDDSPTLEFVGESWVARQADAFVEMARQYISERQTDINGSSQTFLVNVHVDDAALRKGCGRSGLPVETVRRLSCDGDTITIVEDENGEPLNVGRKTRTVPTAIKRALKARDKSCSFPGCHNKRFVDAHHINHWSAGGETSLENLMLLCDRHHRLVHEGGFRIDKDYLGRWIFVRPDGIAVPRCGYHIADRSDDDVDPTINDLARDSAESYLIGVKSLEGC